MGLNVPGMRFRLSTKVWACRGIAGVHVPPGCGVPSPGSQQMPQAEGTQPCSARDTCCHWGGRWWFHNPAVPCISAPVGQPAGRRMALLCQADLSLPGRPTLTITQHNNNCSPLQVKDVVAHDAGDARPIQQEGGVHHNPSLSWLLLPFQVAVRPADAGRAEPRPGLVAVVRALSAWPPPCICSSG